MRHQAKLFSGCIVATQMLLSGAYAERINIGHCLACCCMTAFHYREGRGLVEPVLYVHIAELRFADCRSVIVQYGRFRSCLSRWSC